MWTIFYIYNVYDEEQKYEEELTQGTGNIWRMQRKSWANATTKEERDGEEQAEQQIQGSVKVLYVLASACVAC